MDTQSGSSNQRPLMKLVFWLGLASVIIVLLGVIAGWLIPAMLIRLLVFVFFLPWLNR